MSTSEPQNSGEVRIESSLNKSEQEFVASRRISVQQSLQKLGIQCNQENVPNIALLGSGGGQRAMVGLLGCLDQLDKAGLLDCVLYLSGVSGSTWCMASLYQEPDWSTKLQTVKDKIVKRISGPAVSWKDAFAKLKKYYNEKNHFSLTDVWAALVVTSFVKEIDEHTLTDQQGHNNKDPFPIYTVIDKTCKLHDNGDPWFEITPYEAGYSLTGAFVNASTFGSQFHEGSRKNQQNGFDMLYLQALCGSALADEKEIKKMFLQKIKEFFKQKEKIVEEFSKGQFLNDQEWQADENYPETTQRECFKGPKNLKLIEDIESRHPMALIWNSEGPSQEWQADENYPETTQRECFKGPKNLKLIEDRHAKTLKAEKRETESALGINPQRRYEIKHSETMMLSFEDENSESVDKCYEALMDLVDMNISILNEDDPSALDESIRKKLNELSGGQSQQTEEELEAGCLIKSSQTMSLKLTFNPIKWWPFNVLLHINSCISKWIWGRNHNFLHKITDEKLPSTLMESDTRDYEDAGLLLNSPYMSVLRKERDVDLLISLDFSEGDPFMTVRDAAEMCRKQNIPFPQVNIPDQDIKKPKDFYVFKGKNTPTVIHIPLFNVVNCGDQLKDWRSKYSTFQRAYSAEMITDLMNVAGKNISNNKEKLMEEIRAVIAQKASRAKNEQI